MISGMLDDSKKRRVPTDSGSTVLHVNYLITSPEGVSPSPQAFLVEQGPHETLRSHFHFNSQFQVFVSGAGTIGRHEARPYVVQYAGRQTGYGPITAGESGLGYLSIRSTTITPRAQYLPESKLHLDRGIVKRQAVSSPVNTSEGRHANAVQTMIEPTSDGLGAWHMHVCAGSKMDSPVLANGSGRFYVVVRGEVQTQHVCLRALSVIWTDAGEEPLVLEAGREDLEVIVAQFPQDA